VKVTLRQTAYRKDNRTMLKITPLLVVALVACLAAPALAAPPKATMTVRDVTVRVTVNPGETVRWRSPTIGIVARLSMWAGGKAMHYDPVPGTNRCAAYAYGAGIAVRLTDCTQGKRVDYVRLKATNIGLKPAAFSLRLISESALALSSSRG
jgi:hypothetical protein